LIKYSLLVVT